ncbi:MAG: hypothetical protein K0Q50_1182 [Vampirovibrio sp.]|jgi:hypothetical protein|nr:hypothetical protein [Vampirovibrio sp.]
MGAGALAPLFAHENALSAQQLVQLLRNLLQMPKEMVQLLALLADLEPNMNQELLKKLLTEEAQVPMEELQQFLQNHMDKAQDKLLKLLQTSQMSLTGSGKQMGDLMGTLSALMTKAGKSPAEALHSTISLYLPYYPLHPPQAFSLRFEQTPGQPEEEREQNEQQQQLVLFIQTITLGQFRIEVSQGQQPQWLALVEHDSVASPYREEIQKQVHEALGSPLSQTLSLAFMQRAGKMEESRLPSQSDATSSSSNPAEKQSVGIHPAGGNVPAMAIQCAYLLIRVILEIDNRNALQQGRAALI